MAENSQPHSTFDDAQTIINKGVDAYKKGKKVANTTKIFLQGAQKIAARSSTGFLGGFILSMFVVFIMTMGLFFLIQNGFIDDSSTGGGTVGTVSPGGTISPGQTPNRVFYCQWDKSWSKVSFDDSTIGHAGCSPTSMAMILSSYGGKQWTPVEVASVYDKNGWSWLPGNPYGYIGSKVWNQYSGSNWLKSIGFESADVDVSNGNSLNMTAAKKFLDNGYLLYSGTKTFPGLGGGHSFVVESVDPSTHTMTIRDPNNCNKKFVNLSDNLPWYYSIPVRIK